jgi:hypothetical protein
MRVQIVFLEGFGSVSRRGTGLRVEGRVREVKKKCKNRKNNTVSNKVQQETSAASKRKGRDSEGGGVGGEERVTRLRVTLFWGFREGGNNLMHFLELVVDENFHLWMHYALHCKARSLRWGWRTARGKSVTVSDGEVCGCLTLGVSCSHN